MDSHFESATLESEISMSIAATDEVGGNSFSGESLRRRFSTTHPLHRPLGTPAEHKRYLRLNVEPALLLITIAYGLFATWQPLFLYWARCIEIYKPDNATRQSLINVGKFCGDLSTQNNTVYQDVVEKDIAKTKIFLQMVSGIPSLITAPVLGAWSDGNGGRRKPLLLGSCGLLLYALLQLTASISYNQINIYYTLFAAEVMMGLIGGFATIITSLYAIVTDDSRSQLTLGTSDVPIRIAVASALHAFGQVVGSLLVSLCTVSAKVTVIGHAHGYVIAAFIGVVFAIAALIYVLFGVKETHRTGCSNSQTAIANFEDYRSVNLRNYGCLKSMKMFLYDLFKVILEPRAGWTRFCLNLSTFAIFAEFLALDNQLLYLFVKRYPLEWSDNLYIYHSLMRAFIFAMGMIVFPIVISKLKILGKDSILIIFGVLAGSFQFFLISIADSTFLMFLSNIGAFFAGAIAPGYRTFLPRMVAKEETARLFTVISLTLVICPIISSVLLNSVYNLTITTWPAFVFFLCGVIQLFVVGLQVLVHFLMRPLWIAEKEDALKMVDDGDIQYSDASATNSETSIINPALQSDSSGDLPFDDWSRPIST